MNRDYNAEDTRAFASETNDRSNQIDLIDTSMMKVATASTILWTNGREENRIKLVFAGLIFKKNSQ